jgi:3',5'-cyclic AMP phosphodiesterase CpdA
MKIIHLSDIHIGKSNNKKRFDSIVNWIIDNKDGHGAKVIVLTGDIVDDGSLGQYREAQSQIERLKSSEFIVLSAPGNHDYGVNGIVENWDCIARFKKYISGDVDYPYQVTVDDCAFIMLDSMMQEMNDYELWGAQGELGKQQLSELDRILNDIEENHLSMKVVVALHHHPFYYNYFLKLRDDDLFKKVIMDEDRGDSRINCLLFGHKHSEKRFSGKSSKEKKYNIGLIYASGSSTERTDEGKLIVPVIDLNTNSISRNSIA